MGKIKCNYYIYGRDGSVSSSPDYEVDVIPKTDDFITIPKSPQCNIEFFCKVQSVGEHLDESGQVSYYDIYCVDNLDINDILMNLSN